jgi:hypothetical protein
MRASDLVIVDLSDENATLRERLAVLEICRETLKVAVEQLHVQHGEIERQRRRIVRLVDENRRLRVDILQADAA